MNATHTQQMTPFEAAERELVAADEAVSKVEKEVAPVLDRFATLHAQLDDVASTRGADCPEARKAASTIAGMSAQVAASRAKLEGVQRRRTAVAERFESERRAIALARQAVADQERRVERQAEAVAVARRLVAEKEVAMDVETRELLRLQGELRALIGESEHAERGPR